MKHRKLETKLSSPKEELYPIRTVSNLTGVNSITLRAWERRYGLIKPVRTPKGHRMYTQNDIDLIQEIVGLTDRGISIGQVNLHLNDSLNQRKRGSDPWDVYQRRILNALIRFDTYALDHAYNEALSLYPIDLVTNMLILPLLKTLGVRWEQGEGSVAEEHFFGAFLRNKLGARFHHHPVTQTGPLLFTACLPGEHHEIGLMLFCISALNHGYRLIYLGADMPLHELQAPVKRSQADALLLSGSIEPEPILFSKTLSDLTQKLQIPVFLGGQTAARHSNEIVSAGAIPLGTNIPQGIQKIASYFENN